MRRAKSQSEFDHVTTGHVNQESSGLVWIDCSCGMRMTNGPSWSIDEHIRLHRAEAKYLALSAAAASGMPRLIPREALDLSAVRPEGMPGAHAKAAGKAHD